MLSETFQTSKEEYYLNTTSWMGQDGKIGADVSREQLKAYLSNIECLNTANSSRTIEIEKLQPAPSLQEIRRNLFFLCSLQPAVMVREFDSDDSQVQVTVSKEKILVAWDPQKKKVAATTKGQTWLSMVLGINGATVPLSL
jgi:hypothetical protein